MRLVEKPVMTPQHCAALSHIGDQHPSMRWIDTGNTLEGWNDRVYLCEAAVRQCMSLLGYPMPEEFEAMEVRAVEAEDALLARYDELLAAEAKLAAIELLRASGFEQEPAEAVA